MQKVGSSFLFYCGYEWKLIYYCVELLNQPFQHNYWYTLINHSLFCWGYEWKGRKMGYARKLID
jgi:hypothetical protein